MEKTVFHIPKMDCPSEEQLVRMALRSAPVVRLEFDLPGRRLTVWHETEAAQILSLLEPLRFGAQLVQTQASDSGSLKDAGQEQAQSSHERSTLIWLIAINAVMFVFELAMGIAAQSTGLIGDAADMLADAAVYGVSLYAVGKAADKQAHAARLSGFFQMVLAAGVLQETWRRFIFGSEPEGITMMGVAVLALAANAACMLLIARHRKGGVHMKASWIFSANDVLANLGVILAGALVLWTDSALPDLLIGNIIGTLIFFGAVRILNLSKPPEADAC